MAYQAKFTRVQCQNLVDVIVNAFHRDDIAAIGESIDHLRSTIASLPNDAKGWRSAFGKLLGWMEDVQRYGFDHAKPAFTVFTKGNGKLPFYSFSVLPGVTCPGAGECLSFCYSFRGWRFPGSFARQLQNTVLMIVRHNRAERNGRDFEPIRQAFETLPFGSIVRLYVDGDFSSIADVQFWFELLNDRKDIKAYGYSKSWVELLAYANKIGFDNLPSNYTLNVSSGSVHDDNLRALVMELPITRGEFSATPINEEGLPKGVKRYDSKEYHTRVRQSFADQTGRKAFSCPGKCGSCRFSSGMHACGDRTFTVPIAIGVH